MGIPGFNRWILSTFPEIVRVQGPKLVEVYDHVAFDINQILHQAARRATSRVSLASTIFRELDHILKSCVPRKSVFFAFDGPAPLAKLLTQRKRRHKASNSPEYTPKPTDVPPRTSARHKRGPNAARTIDRLELTPGVDTLYFVHAAVEYWSFSRLKNDRKYADVDVRISGADVPGEGELKLIDFCRVSNIHGEESVVIVGGDADIILQGLATVPVRNFFIYLRKFDRSGKKPKSYVISVWELARTLERMFPNESSSTRIDFILLSLLNGNDYAPKLRGVTFSRLWRRYVSLKCDEPKQGGPPPFQGHCLVDARWRTINWAFFHALIDKISIKLPSIDEVKRIEEELKKSSVEEQVGEQGAAGSAAVEEDDGDDEVMEDEVMGDADDDTVEEEGEAIDDGVEERGVGAEDDHIETLVAISGDASKYYDTEQWCRALLWTIHMYVDGYCSDYTFQYGCPYAPCSEVVTRYIEEHNGDPFVLQAPVNSAQALLPHHAAMALLPRSASHLLPRPLRALLDDAAATRRIYPTESGVDVAQMIREIERIPLHDYARVELERLVHGEPFLLRRARNGEYVARAPTPPMRLVQSFGNVRPFPIVVREPVRRTTAPPCYAWPAGVVEDMLRLPYKVVGGQPLQAGRGANAKPSASPPVKAAATATGGGSGKGGSGKEASSSAGKGGSSSGKVGGSGNDQGGSSKEASSSAGKSGNISGKVEGSGKEGSSSAGKVGSSSAIVGGSGKEGSSSAGKVGGSGDDQGGSGVGGVNDGGKKAGGTRRGRRSKPKHGEAGKAAVEDQS